MIFGEEKSLDWTKSKASGAHDAVGGVKTNLLRKVAGLVGGQGKESGPWTFQILL